jgi:hypothetical protein
MKVLERKPRPAYGEGAEVVLTERDYTPYHPYVVATVTPAQLAEGEWCHGYYFQTLTEAVNFFNDYPERKG